jgi:hypothetical protein
VRVCVDYVSRGEGRIGAMSTEVAVRDEALISGGSVSLTVAAERVRSLIAESDTEALDEVRRQAEAHSLYEQRAGHADRARHFSVLRLLAEAGLGAISFDSPELVPRGKRGNWRSLAAALERGRLLEICEATERLGTEAASYEVRRRGWSRVSPECFGRSSDLGPIPWGIARRLAREKGIAFESLPSCAAEVRREQANREAAARSARARQAAWETAEREKLRELTTRAAKEHGAGIDSAYALLRRTIQALDEARAGFAGADQEPVDDAMHTLYRAEDLLGVALRVRDDPWAI